MCAKVQADLNKVDSSGGSPVVLRDNFSNLLAGSANSVERVAYAELAKLAEVPKVGALAADYGVRWTVQKLRQSWQLQRRNARGMLCLLRK